MQRRLVVVAVVAAVAVLGSLPAAAQHPRVCGGEHPRWALVTFLGVTYHLVDQEDGGIDIQRTSSAPSPTVLRVCDIASVGVLPGTGETVISRHSFRPSEYLLESQWIILETPAQLCAALPTCDDATWKPPESGRRTGRSR